MQCMPMCVRHMSVFDERMNLWWFCRVYWSGYGVSRWTINVAGVKKVFLQRGNSSELACVDSSNLFDFITYRISVRWHRVIPLLQLYSIAAKVNTARIPSVASNSFGLDLQSSFSPFVADLC